jgi:steroid delta-isomerase-like uncharacterized protein
MPTIARAFLSLSLVALAACAAADDPPATPSTPAPQEPAPERLLVEAYFAAFNQHDVDAVMDLYAPHATMLDPTYDEPVEGKDVIRQHLVDLFAAVPDVNDEVVSTVVQPGFAAVEIVATGTAVGTTEPFTLPIATIFTIADGRITRDATYYDR